MDEETVKVIEKTMSVRKSPSVLMVEDDSLIRLIHTIMLQDLQCEVETAATAQEALDKADHPYDLILLDIGLPDMQGTELAAQLRLHPRHQQTPMVFVTTFTAEELGEACTNLAIHQVINKPVNKKSFKSVIAETMPRPLKSLGLSA
ncbi:MAG: response regulator [Gammaproteobacteria bacterium]|nr:response regulator [Gammaproteobacteria bacterium]MBP9729113.1 response regulator [Gammaproteobacteria bacterium]